MIFNVNHYEKVLKKRHELGLNVNHKKLINNSIYVGKKIVSFDNKKEYIFEEDWEEYSYVGNGWFKRMLISYNGSHRTIFYENINNEDESMISLISKTRKEFGL